MYHGWADQQVTPYASLDFYYPHGRQAEPGGTDAFLRLFMLPGINHCPAARAPAISAAQRLRCSHDPRA